MNPSLSTMLANAPRIDDLLYRLAFPPSTLKGLEPRSRALSDFRNSNPSARINIHLEDVPVIVSINSKQTLAPPRSASTTSTTVPAWRRYGVVTDVSVRNFTNAPPFVTDDPYVVLCVELIERELAGTHYTDCFFNDSCYHDVTSTKTVTRQDEAGFGGRSGIAKTISRSPRLPASRLIDLMHDAAIKAGDNARVLVEFEPKQHPTQGSRTRNDGHPELEMLCQLDYTTVWSDLFPRQGKLPSSDSDYDTFRIDGTPNDMTGVLQLTTPRFDLTSCYNTYVDDSAVLVEDDMRYGLSQQSFESPEKLDKFIALLSKEQKQKIDAAQRKRNEKRSK